MIVTELQEYKCPNCGGAIAFDSSLQKMKCPYCDAEFEVEALQQYDEALNQQPEEDMAWDTAAGTEWQKEEQEGLRTYICRSCGGEIVGDENLAASSCPFCGNPIVVMGQFAGSLKPDYVIPFKVDRKAAIEGLQKHLKGKRLLPKVFKDQNHIDEIKGVYVPFWLFDTDADASILYHATVERTWSDSDYDYEESRHYMVLRSGSLGFNHVPVDGSSRMNDALMESIEPYDFSQAVPFKTAYLAGFMADKYDVDAEKSVERANERVKCSTEEAFAATAAGYTTIRTESSSIQLHDGRARYALCPVWLLNTTWQGKQYTFAMNGQTGRFVGDLPMDQTAFWLWSIGLSAGCMAGAFGIARLLWMIL